MYCWTGCKVSFDVMVSDLNWRKVAPWERWRRGNYPNPSWLPPPSRGCSVGEGRGTKANRETRCNSWNSTTWTCRYTLIHPAIHRNTPYVHHDTPLYTPEIHCDTLCDTSWYTWWCTSVINHITLSDTPCNTTWCTRCIHLHLQYILYNMDNTVYGNTHWYRRTHQYTPWFTSGVPCETGIDHPFSECVGCGVLHVMVYLLNEAWSSIQWHWYTNQQEYTLHVYRVTSAHICVSWDNHACVLCPTHYTQHTRWWNHNTQTTCLPRMCYTLLKHEPTGTHHDNLRYTLVACSLQPHLKGMFHVKLL